MEVAVGDTAVPYVGSTPFTDVLFFFLQSPQTRLALHPRLRTVANTPLIWTPTRSRSVWTFFQIAFGVQVHDGYSSPMAN